MMLSFSTPTSFMKPLEPASFFTSCPYSNQSSEYVLVTPSDIQYKIEAQSNNIGYGIGKFLRNRWENFTHIVNKVIPTNRDTDLNEPETSLHKMQTVQTPVEQNIELPKIDLEKENQELNDLLKINSMFITDITDEEFARIKELLKLGARPKCEKDGGWCNLFRCAARTKHLELIDLLIQYGIKPDVDFIRSLAGGLTKKTDRPEDQVYDKLVKSLMTSEDTAIFEEAIVKKYHELFNIILQEKEVAQRDNIPLMILIGEMHEQLDAIHSLLSELLVLNLSLENLNIKTVMTEAFELSRFRGLTSWHVSYDVAEYIMRIDGGKIIEIDQALNQFDERIDTLHGWAGEDGMKLRNTVMAKVACAYSADTQEDVVSIVGAHHLKGLIEETNLNHCYHVVPINAAGPGKQTDPSYSSQCDGYMSSKKVTQGLFINQLKTYISPQVAKELAKKVHEQETSNLAIRRLRRVDS